MEISDYLHKLPGENKRRQYYNEQTGEIISYRQYRKLVFSPKRQKRAKIFQSALRRKYGTRVAIQKIYALPEYESWEQEITSKDDVKVNRALNYLRNHPVSLLEDKAEYDWIA